MTLTALAFYVFASVAVAAGLFVVLARNPVHSVLWLILSFFSAAGLMVLLGAEFVAMLLIIVYVGAVAVLFLFVVMMLDVDFTELKQGLADYLPLGALIGLVLLVELGLVIGHWAIAGSAPDARAAVAPVPAGNRQCRGVGAHPLRRVHLPVPGGGTDPSGGDDRRHRADALPPTGHQASGHPEADLPQARGCGGAEATSSRGRGSEHGLCDAKPQ